MLYDSSGSSRGDNLPPIHKRRMVWSSSSGPEAFFSMNSMICSYDSEARKFEMAKERFEKARADAEAKATKAQQQAEAEVAAEKAERQKLANESLRLRQKSKIMHGWLYPIL
ncbi:hypothetical protein ISN45_Aa05g009630 [Arabidopsis thaliana x Arabidopsis arenosa]|uniref:Uncharacterized protein n=1 Tax=Arabidopsis thaliana x Arabidopsis arenosa TaxID=1240361 RepID=A0A8T1ZLL6_9BRAS|nr:hypothetical protein ISN45_Aa05g009630 [Arabidopsis thaliana x Arabidopsis arenosa]